MRFLAQPFRRFPRASRVLTLAFLVGLVMLFWPARPLRSDNFVFYFPKARHVLPLEVIEQARYLPLLKVLNLVGTVSGLQEKRNSLKIFFGDTQMELRLNEKTVRVNRTQSNLSEPVRLARGQWMVPVGFLTSVLPQLTREPIEYHMGSNRIFIGDIAPRSFTVRLDPIPNGARLTLQFTDKLAVRTASRNGKWIMFLDEQPVEPLEQTFRFQDPYVSELRFDDQDGIPKLILTPTAGGLNFYPALAEGGKVLLADVQKPPPVSPPEPPAEQPPTATGPTAPPPAGSEQTTAAPTEPLLPVVVLDAGHGGEDTGAQSRDRVLEKDLAAQLVARVRLALLATQKYRIVLTRVGDLNPSFDERDAVANLAAPVAFLTFHAGDLGRRTPRVAVYTYRAPSPLVTTASGAPSPLFIPWLKAQQASLDPSRQLAAALQEQFAQLVGVITDPPGEAPVRALRSVNAPAVAIEIGSLAPDAESGILTNPGFLGRISAAIAQALEAFQGRQPKA